jgi:hypothetical protein
MSPVPPEITRVRRAARQVTAATGRRDAAIVDARAAGYPLRVIAEAAGLTHPGVIKILRRRSEV